MLSKRTNILFEDSQWEQLVSHAKKEQISVGSLIRKAVFTVYFKGENDVLKERREAIDRIRKIRKQIKKPVTTKEIIELINYGRKF